MWVAQNLRSLNPRNIAAAHSFDSCVSLKRWKTDKEAAIRSFGKWYLEQGSALTSPHMHFRLSRKFPLGQDRQHVWAQAWRVRVAR